MATAPVQVALADHDAGHHAGHETGRHAPADEQQEHGVCECLGDCASGATATTPSAPVLLAVTVGEQRATRLAVATARLADRVRFALPWATAPPA